MKSLQARHGADSIAVLITGKICTEEMALLGSLFKFGMGGRHADSTPHPCPASGSNSECSALGSHWFANGSSLLGGRDFNQPAHREAVAHILGIPVQRIPDQSSWDYDQIMDGLGNGAIRGLWIIATNASHAGIWPDRFHQLAEKLDFLVVQDLYGTTETAREAHLILPAAGWGEKDGTLIHSDRRLGLVKKIRRAPGEALSDFSIFRLIATGWGCSDLFREWQSPEAAFQILKRLSAGQTCDLTGIRDYRHLDESGGIQWPYRSTASPEPLPTKDGPYPRSVATQRNRFLNQ